MSRKCIFCGRRANSGEHLWSEALHDSLRQYVGSSTKASHMQSEVAGQNPLDRLKLHNGPLYTVKINCVCDRCNNGWMNRLDERVRPLVVELINGRDVVFGSDEARVLAGWIGMKMMVAEQKFADTAAFTAADHINLYLTGLPPDHFEVRLCHSRSMYTASMFHRQPWAVANQIERNQMIATWGLGRLLVMVEYCPVTQRALPLPVSNLRLWPSPFSNLQFPTYPLTILQVDRAACRYNPRKLSAALHPNTFHPDLRGLKKRRAREKGII